MKGVILCGGEGTRLKPLTNVTNKHLLPIYNRPMIHYPIKTLVQSGIREIMLVCGGNAAGDFLRIVGNGEEFGLKHVSYTYQKTAGGIAHALKLAEEWSCHEPVCVMLGDNVLENPFPELINDFETNPNGSYIFTTEVAHPQWYGVVEMDKNSKITKIVEKPKNPKSNLIAIGVYLYDSSVWDYIHNLKPSGRGELEITDLNKKYLKAGKLKAKRILGAWMDCGESIDTYLDACIMMRKIKKQRE